MTPIERRLRQALAARAERVTETTLVRHHPDPGLMPAGGIHILRPGTWSPKVTSLMAAVAVLLVAGVTWLYAAGPLHDTVPARPAPSLSSAPAPTIGATSTPSATLGPTAVRTAGEYSRSAIPWDQVGPGWTAALWAPTPPGSGKNAALTLYLVSPRGARYSVGTVSTDERIMDISGDGRRILLTTSGHSGLVVWDVGSGTARPVHLPAGAQIQEAVFTRPTGTALWMRGEFNQSGPQQLRRTGLDGTVQLTAPTTAVGITMSPDGRFLVGDATASWPAKVSVLDNATGAVAYTFANPEGTQGCVQQGWWPDGRLVVSCDEPTASTSNLWTYDVSTRTQTRITRASGAGNGFSGGWPTSEGTVTRSEFCPETGSALGIVAPSATSAQQLPGMPPLPGTPVPEAVVDDTVYVLTGCQGLFARDPEIFFSYDVATHALLHLLGTGANGGAVIMVKVISG